MVLVFEEFNVFVQVFVDLLAELELELLRKFLCKLSDVFRLLYTVILNVIGDLIE